MQAAREERSADAQQDLDGPDIVAAPNGIPLEPVSGAGRESPTANSAETGKADGADANTSSGSAVTAEQGQAPQESAPPQTTQPRLTLPSPTEPMTYSQITESGYGVTMPDVLWVPYHTISPEKQQKQRRDKPGDVQSLDSRSSESHKRHLSNDLEQGLSPEKKAKEQPADQGAPMDHVRGASRRGVSSSGRKSSSGDKSSARVLLRSNWDGMPEAIMHIVFGQLDLRAQQQCRMVSKYWHSMVNNNLKAVQPSKSRIHALQNKFRRLVSIDFSRCEQLRNRNIHVLATSSLRLEEVKFGHITMGIFAKPRITNKGLEYLATMTSLKSVLFADCNAFTNTGVEKLSSLVNLRELSFIRCTRVSEKGLSFMQSLPHLSSLTVHMCAKVTDGLLSTLKPLQELRHLHLGHVRLTRERLEDLFTEGQSRLEEFTVHGVELTAGSLIALSSCKSLTALGMTACFQVDTQTTISQFQHLTNLQRLNLMSITDTSNIHLLEITNNLPNLQHLKIVLSSTITALGIETLARLENLTAVSFESSHASQHALHAVSALTGLTSAEFPGTSIPHELLNALPYISCLEHLSLRSHPENFNILTVKPLWIGTLEPLLRCTHLKSLDMSWTDMNFTLINDLLEKLQTRDLARKLERPVLEEICMHGCIIKDDSIHVINRAHPSVLCHKKQPQGLESSTWVPSRQPLPRRA